MADIVTDLQVYQEEDQDLFEHYRFVVDKGQGMLRIDKYLMLRIENASRNKVQAAAVAGNILVNGEPVKPSYKVKPEDTIVIMMVHPVRDEKLYPENIPLEILYEDDDVIVVVKPPGMVVHPAFGNYSGTLVNALLYHLMQNGAMDQNKTTGPYLVHRIDKDTSGAMIVAKNEESQMIISRMFYHHTIQRRYAALVWGDLKNEEGTITGNIARSIKNRKVFSVFKNENIGKHAVTHYKVIERFGYVTLIECRLETGRTHQIRVHLKHIGHPLFNDETYGGNTILKGTTFTKYQQFVKNCFKVCSRQALHARSIGFNHPRTNAFLYFEAPYPPDLEEVLTKWRNYALHKHPESD